MPSETPENLDAASEMAWVSRPRDSLQSLASSRPLRYLLIVIAVCTAIVTLAGVIEKKRAHARITASTQLATERLPLPNIDPLHSELIARLERREWEWTDPILKRQQS